MNYLVNDIGIITRDCGTQQGLPMIALRLQACPVGCVWCNARETWTADRKDCRPTLAAVLGKNPLFCEASPEEIVECIEQIRGEQGPQWVLVTGGEPAIYNLAPLVKQLHKVFYRVAVETSGTGIGHVEAGFDWVSVSPKIGMPGGMSLKAVAFAVANEILFPVTAPADLGNLERLRQLGYIKGNIPVFRQYIHTPAKIALR